MLRAVQSFAFLAVCAGSLAACAAADLQIQVFPDGSGRYRIADLDLIENAMEDQPPPPGHEGLWLAESQEVRLSIKEYGFDDCNTVNIGGITLKRTATETGPEFTVSIPLAPSSPWYRNLGLTEERRARLVTLKTKSEDEMPSARLGGKTPLDLIQLKLSLPAALRSVEVLRPENGIPLWAQAAKGENRERGREDLEREVILKIPIDDIATGGLPDLVLRCTCGPDVPQGVLDDWNEFKAKHGKRPGATPPK